MSFIQAAIVNAVTSGLTVSTFVMETLGVSRVLNFNFSSGAVTLLTESPTPYFIRSLWKDSSRVIRVFNASGDQVYSFERLSTHNPVWSLLTFPERREVAAIDTSFFNKSVNFHNISGVTHRDVTSHIGLSGLSQNFYLKDGAIYSWSKGSKYLERIINPNGSDEEIRERIAKVKLMRQFKFDFEMLVDEQKIRPEIALSTGFISMLTQWGLGESTSTIGPTYTTSQENKHPETNQIVLMVESQSANITIEPSS